MPLVFPQEWRAHPASPLKAKPIIPLKIQENRNVISKVTTVNVMVWWRLPGHSSTIHKAIPSGQSRNTLAHSNSRVPRPDPLRRSVVFPSHQFFVSIRVKTVCLPRRWGDLTCAWDCLGVCPRLVWNTRSFSEFWDCIAMSSEYLIFKITFKSNSRSWWLKDKQVIF